MSSRELHPQQMSAEPKAQGIGNFQLQPRGLGCLKGRDWAWRQPRAPGGPDDRHAQFEAKTNARQHLPLSPKAALQHETAIFPLSIISLGWLFSARLHLGTKGDIRTGDRSRNADYAGTFHGFALSAVGSRGVSVGASRLVRRKSVHRQSISTCRKTPGPRWGERTGFS